MLNGGKDQYWLQKVLKTKSIPKREMVIVNHTNCNPWIMFWILHLLRPHKSYFMEGVGPKVINVFETF